MSGKRRSVSIAIENLLEPAQHFPSGDDGVWRNHRLIWKQPASWAPQLTAWLTPGFRSDGLRRLKPGIFRDLGWDDSDWSRVLEKCLTADIAYHADKLAEAFEHAIVRTYHGCRTTDAGIYHREGLRTHDRALIRQESENWDASLFQCFDSIL